VGRAHLEHRVLGPDPIAFFLQRLLGSAPTLLGISAIVFAIVVLAPGDPLSELARDPDIPVEVREGLRRQFGLDEPLHVRYLTWLGATLRGDLGQSFANGVDVRSLIWQRLPTTIFVMGTAYALGLVVALVVGTASAVKQYSWIDIVATGFAYVGYSLPTFFTGLLLILVLGVHLRALPIAYHPSTTVTGIAWALEYLRNAAMPIIVLALYEAAVLTRYVRASMLDVIHMEYITTARSKGFRDRYVFVQHALRNALIPVVTIAALQVPTIFTGAIVTEQIFRVPGIGLLLIDAFHVKDTPVVMAIVFSYAVLVVVFNLVADVVYGVLDPRIRTA
jgi:peptide/nickel transport system permease protein